MGEMGQEPTMEAILSSIKKIIAEDDAKARSVPRARAAEPPVMDPVAPSQAQAASAQAAPAQTVDAPLELKPGWADAPDAALPSGEATAASLQALSNLSRLVAKPDTAGAQTLDGLVREMLTPLLKQWLDAHLPEIVERHVAQEVARLSRQAQG